MAKKKRNVVIGFETKNLSRAEGLARSISAKVKQAKDLATDTAQVVRGRVRETLKEIRALKDGAIERDRLAQRAEALKDRAIDGRAGAQLLGGLRRANEVRKKAESALNLLGGSTGALPGLLGLVPGGGLAAAAASLIVPLVEKIVAQAMEREQKRAELFRIEINDRIERLAYQLDYSRRLEEDPAFANAEAKKAFNMAVAEERAMATGGWHESADFLESFGG